MLCEYDVEGGYTNQMSHVAVHEDGTVDLVRGGARSRTHWDDEEVRALAADLEASGLFGEDHDFPGPRGAADLRRHQIRYAGACVVAYDTAVPPQLASVLTRLEQALLST